MPSNSSPSITSTGALFNASLFQFQTLNTLSKKKKNCQHIDPERGKAGIRKLTTIILNTPILTLIPPIPLPAPFAGTHIIKLDFTEFEGHPLGRETDSSDFDFGFSGLVGFARGGVLGEDADVGCAAEALDCFVDFGAVVAADFFGGEGEEGGGEGC